MSRDITPYLTRVEKMVAWSRRMLPSFEDRITTPRVDWIPKATARRYGDYSPTEELIRLNHFYAALAPDIMLIHTLPHEFAHHLTHKVFPKAKQGHGPEFRSICRKLGIPEEARTDAFLTKARKHRTLPARCDCGTVTNVTFTMARRIEEGKLYSCKICKGSITLALTLKGA